jgi:hypothetical protein
VPVCAPVCVPDQPSTMSHADQAEELVAADKVHAFVEKPRTGTGTARGAALRYTALLNTERHPRLRFTPKIHRRGAIAARR